MPKHPSDGALRRLLDEPVAVAVADEDHASQCPRCQDRMGLMREDDTVVRLAFAGEVEMTPAAVALERFRTAERAGLVLVGGQPGGRLGREAVPRRPRLRRPLLRPATVITCALVLMGGATAAAATGLVPIFSPESVAPVVVQAGDIASLQALSRFGTVTGTSKLDLTPESSATALASAASFSLPAVTPPSGAATGPPSYWLVSPESAQLQISVAKVEQAAAKDGGTVPPAPPGVDGSVLQVATGAGALEVWGLALPGGAGASVGLFGHSSSKASNGTNGTSAAGPASSGNGPVASELPQLAVAEVQGPTVSSSGPTWPRWRATCSPSRGSPLSWPLRYGLSATPARPCPSRCRPGPKAPRSTSTGTRPWCWPRAARVLALSGLRAAGCSPCSARPASLTC